MENEIMDFLFCSPLHRHNDTFPGVFQMKFYFIYPESSVFSHQYPPKSFALGQ